MSELTRSLSEPFIYVVFDTRSLRPVVSFDVTDDSIPVRRNWNDESAEFRSGVRKSRRNLTRVHIFHEKS